MKSGILTILLILFSMVIYSQNNLLEGEWVPKDSSNDISRLVIAQNNGIWSVHVWGTCYPDACDWGKSDLKTFGSFPLDKSISYGFAQWDQGFIDQYLTLHLSEKILVVEIYSCFKDKLGPSNYHSIILTVRK